MTKKLVEQEELPIEKRVTQREISDEVLGKASGYVKGLGFGPKPSMIRFKPTIVEKNRLQDVIQTQQAELEAQQQKIEDQQERLTTQEVEIFHNKENIVSIEDRLASMEAFFKHIYATIEIFIYELC